MVRKFINHFRIPHFFIISFVVVRLGSPIYSQISEKDTTIHPYHVNYWITSGVIVAGLAAEKIGIPWIDKSSITNAELLALNRNDLNAIDRWALDFDASNMDYYVTLTDRVLAGVVLLPVLTMIDSRIRKDWLDILMMYVETVTISNNLYLYTPLGPTFQNRLRPVVYYDQLGDSEIRTRGANRNSFYSGHVASAATASFFTAKIFCDYHPELKWKKYLVYGAASIPPLIVSYLRLRSLAHFPSDILVGFGVGALCGIMIPELHRIQSEKISVGVYSSFEGVGLSVNWKPDF
jgi:membrane-associated phospholipid phosphatase